MQDFNSLEIPNSTGVYTLHLELSQPRSLRIGRLGEFIVPPGQYLYVGSAFGPGGLKARLGRHLLSNKRLHWHIDWLRPATSIKGYFYIATGEQLECSWSQYLMHQRGAIVPVPGFGSSDCRNRTTACAAHLVCLKMDLDANMICNKLPIHEGSRVVYQKLTSHFQPDCGDIE